MNYHIKFLLYVSWWRGNWDSNPELRPQKATDLESAVLPLNYSPKWEEGQESNLHSQSHNLLSYRQTTDLIKHPGTCEGFNFREFDGEIEYCCMCPKRIKIWRVGTHASPTIKGGGCPFRPQIYGAGTWNRTKMYGLEDRCSVHQTIPA